MKNRIVALALAICILCMFGSPISVRAETADSYLLPDYDAYQRFMEGSFSALFDHRLYLAALNAYAGYHWCLDGASRLLGEDLSVERCTEILANMATLLNYQLEEGIVEQAEMDTTMTLIDYGVSAADIAAGRIGTDALEGAANSVLDELAAAIGVANGALQVTAETIDELELLIQLAGDFSMQYDFFDTVYRYSDIPEMKEAAGTLLLAAQELMQHKLDMFNSVSSAVAKVEAHDIFLDQVAKELLADPDLFDSDAWLAVKALSNAYSNYSGEKLAFDVAAFLVDELFGTNDTYIRYTELVAMRDIRDALLSRIEASPVLGHDDYGNMASNIARMKMALHVDARGEYCAYQMVTEDEKLAELTRVSNGKSIKDNYDASIRIIESAYDRLDKLYTWQPLPTAERSSSDELVNDAFYDYIENPYGYGSTYYHYHIPQINLENDKAEEINQEIYDELYENVLKPGVYDNATYPSISGVAYCWTEKDNIISIMVSISDAHADHTTYRAYNVSAKTGEKISDEALLQQFGLTQDGFYDLARAELDAKYRAEYKEPQLPAEIHEEYMEMLNHTLSEENIRQAVPYIDPGGDLCIVVNIYSLAGAGSHYCLINLTGESAPKEPSDNTEIPPEEPESTG